MGPRTRILDAAMLVFRRQGFRRSSIEQAAEAAGLTRQALYHHFESKEALFSVCIQREAAALKAAVSSAVEPGAAPDRQLWQGLRALFTHVAEHPHARSVSGDAR